MSPAEPAARNVRHFHHVEVGRRSILKAAGGRSVVSQLRIFGYDF
jgi:hypothetical protein